MGGQGFIRYLDPNNGEETQFTHFEPYDAHMVFPCFDQPDIKATWTVTTLSPPEWTVISNGEEEQRSETASLTPELAVKFPSPTPALPCTLRKFRRSPLISTYLCAVIAGQFTVYSDIHEKIPLRILVRNSAVPLIESRIKELLEVTKRGFKFFEWFFGVPYAFPKYDQAFVPAMIFGGMENVGCVTLSEMTIKQNFYGVTKFGHEMLVYSMLHELCHHWFGDLVTLRWWDDLWLNEGFASFMGYYCVRKAEGLEKYRVSLLQFYMQKYIAYGTDERKGGHPVVMEMKTTSSTKDLFDNITYNKGAAVLEQLFSIVGEEAFRDGLRLYLEKYKFGNADLSDMLKCVQIAAEKRKVQLDFPYWAEQWLHTVGANVLLPQFKCSDGLITEFIVQQISVGTEEEYYRSHLIDIALIYGDGFDVVLVPNVSIEATEDTMVDAIIGRPEPAAVVLNWGDKTYAITQFDPVSVAYLKGHMHKMTDPYNRYMVAYSSSRMQANQLMSNEDYMCFHPYLGLLEK